MDVTWTARKVIASFIDILSQLETNNNNCIIIIDLFKEMFNLLKDENTSDELIEASILCIGAIGSNKSYKEYFVPIIPFLFKLVTHNNLHIHLIVCLTIGNLLLLP